METTDYTLITVIANLILQPILQYLLHSRCSKIDLCCLHCERQIKIENV